MTEIKKKTSSVAKEKKEPVKKEKKTFKYVCPTCGDEIKAKPEKHIICGECECQFVMEG